MITNSLNFPAHEPQNDAVLFFSWLTGTLVACKGENRGSVMSAASLVQLCPALAAWGPLLSGLFFGKSPLSTPPFPLKLSDAFSLLTPYATSLWYKTGVTELREDWPFVHLHFSWMIFNLFLDEEGFFFFCLLGKISVLKLKKIFLSCLWMFKLTFQWFLTFLPVPDFSRLLSRCVMKLRI